MALSKRMSGKPVKSGQVDMTTGALFPKMIRFAIPVMLSGILQLLFNAADVVVVGKFAGSNALASLSPTGALTNLIINLFIGMSVGSSVLVGHYLGANRDDEVRETVHTSIAFALFGGVILIALGCILCRPLLRMMNTPEEIIGGSTIYMTIYFIGMPVIMVYNFGASILRAAGDTKRPLIYLSFAGVANVLLNMFFVIVCRLSVAGVALATVLSQALSACLVVRCLMMEPGSLHLDLKKLHINKAKMIRIAKIGLPAGLQGMVFSFSNVLIQSSVNSFGATAMAANTAGQNIEGFVYVALNAMYQTNVSFTSQNYGARQIKRIPMITIYCVLVAGVLGVVLGNGAYYAASSLLSIYTSEPEVIAIGTLRLGIITKYEALCGIMDTLVGSIRGLGYSILPMIVSLTGACLFRVIWIYTVFQSNRTLECLYSSYPISWTLTGLAHLICLLVIYRKKFGFLGGKKKF